MNCQWIRTPGLDNLKNDMRVKTDKCSASSRVQFEVLLPA